MNFSLGIITFDGVARLDCMLKSLRRNCDLSKFTNLVVVHDPCSDDPKDVRRQCQTDGYKKVCKEWKFSLYNRPKWGHMQGAANDVFSMLS